MMRLRRRVDPSARLQEVLSLGGDASSREQLLAAVDDDSLNVARAALRRLVPLAGPEEIVSLRKRLLELDIGIVGDVAAALRELGDAKAAIVAAKELAAGSRSRRHKAAVALRELRDPAAREVLLSALEDGAAAVRRVAVEALSVLPPDAEIVSAWRRLVDDPDPSVRAAVVRALARADPDAPVTLQAMLHDRDASVRAELAAAGVSLDDESVRSLLADTEAAVRIEALEALADHPRAALAPVVLAALSDVDWHVRRAACNASAALGVDSAAPLVHMLVDPRLEVRGRAIVVLERLFGAGLDALLQSHMAQARAPLRRALVELLGRRGRGDLALGLASDPSVDVRIAVAHALAGDDSADARAALRNLCDDHDRSVRHAAITALAPTGAAGRHKASF